MVLNVGSVKAPVPDVDTLGISFERTFPIPICLSSLSNAFQLIPEFALSVFIPNFTDSPGLIFSDDLKIITPRGVFSPIHPFSVLKDLKL